MSVRSSVGLASRLAVASVGRTMIVFDSHRVVDIFGYHYMMEDWVDHYSS